MMRTRQLLYVIRTVYILGHSISGVLGAVSLTVMDWATTIIPCYLSMALVRLQVGRSVAVSETSPWLSDMHYRVYLTWRKVNKVNQSNFDFIGPPTS